MDNNNLSTDLVSIEELCDILKVGKNAAYTLLKEGKIKSFKIGRSWKIPRAAVDQYIITESKIYNNPYIPECWKK